MRMKPMPAIVNENSWKLNLILVSEEALWFQANARLRHHEGLMQNLLIEEASSVH